MGRPIRAIFAREEVDFNPERSVFLAGPSPGDGDMLLGWRRKVLKDLQADPLLNDEMSLVIPEPRSGYWEDINESASEEEEHDTEMDWEVKHLERCRITAFWLPMYWKKEVSENFPPNIGPSTRWEFGFFFHRYLQARKERSFVVGSPEDAQNIRWAKKISIDAGLTWHSLPKSSKVELVASSFTEEIKSELLQNI